MAKKPSSKNPAPVNPTPDFQNTNDPLAIAQRNLQAQVDSGGITAAQAQAELARLRTLPIQQVEGLNANANPGGSTGSPSSPLPNAYGPGPITNSTPLNTPQQITQAQYGADKQYIADQMQSNRLDEINPYGSSQYVQGPNGNQIKVQTVGNVNPMDALGWQGQQFQNQSYIDRALQAIAGEGGENNQGQSGLLPQLRGMFSSALDFSKAPAAPDANGYQADRSHVENSLYDRFAQVNEPLFERQQAQFREQMANKGIPVGSESYNRQFEQLQRAQNDARQAARTQAIGLGGQEQQRLFDDTNTLRGNNISEMLTQRNQPLQDLRGLLSAVNPLQLPQFNATANVNVPQQNVSGIADNALTRQSNEALAKAGFANQLALANLNNEAASGLQQQGFQNQQTLQQNAQNFANSQKPSGGDFLGGIAGGFLGGIAGGLGQSFGNWGAGLFK